MHFEYRPELLSADCREGPRPPPEVLGTEGRR
jgi:hypothetical protein